MNKPVIVVKAGGLVAENETTLKNLAKEVSNLSPRYHFILVHGGGSTVSSIQKTFGIKPVFKDGIRITSKKEMELVDMGLAGCMNKKLVRIFIKYGIRAAGISGADGATFIGKSIGDTNCRTGKIVRTDKKLIQTLIGGGFVPILSSVSIDNKGDALNINADEAALAAGTAFNASQIIFISNTAGIINGDKYYSQLNEHEIYNLIAQKIIKGGMVPKVESSLKALKNGARSVVIGNYSDYSDLEKLLAGKKGTQIWLK